MNPIKPPEEETGDGGDADEEKDYIDERIAMPKTMKRGRSSTNRTQADGDQEGRSASQPSPWRRGSATGADNTSMFSLIKPRKKKS